RRPDRRPTAGLAGAREFAATAGSITCLFRCVLSVGRGDAGTDPGGAADETFGGRERRSKRSRVSFARSRADEAMECCRLLDPYRRKPTGSSVGCKGLDRKWLTYGKGARSRRAADDPPPRRQGKRMSDHFAAV